MFAMSVNEVPGWLVTIPPSGIGVPVAFTPGLLPHCEVCTVAPPEPAFPEEPEAPAVPPLPQPARAASPIAATSATADRAPGACPRIVIRPPPLLVTASACPVCAG